MSASAGFERFGWGSAAVLKLHRRHPSGCDSWRIFTDKWICCGFLDCSEEFAAEVARALKLELDATTGEVRR